MGLCVTFAMVQDISPDARALLYRYDQGFQIGATKAVKAEDYEIRQRGLFFSTRAGLLFCPRCQDCADYVLAKPPNVHHLQKSKCEHSLNVDRWQLKIHQKDLNGLNLPFFRGVSELCAMSTLSKCSQLWLFWDFSFLGLYHSRISLFWKCVPSPWAYPYTPSQHNL